MLYVNQVYNEQKAFDGIVVPWKKRTETEQKKAVWNVLIDVQGWNMAQGQGVIRHRRVEESREHSGDEDFQVSLVIFSNLSLPAKIPTLCKLGP